MLAAVALLAGALALLASRDDATTGTGATRPGHAAVDPAPLRADLQAGNVVILAPTARQAAEARTLAADLGATESAALRRVGQAVIVRRGTVDATTVAYARGRVIRVSEVGDPALRAFVEFWLGR